MLAHMQDPDADSTDDELFDWFIAALNREHSAREIRDGVIEVALDSGRRVEMLLTRQQLRQAAWSDEDIVDDTNDPVVPPAANPVLAGLRELLIYADEELAAGIREGEKYVVLDDGFFRGSKTPTVPPVRGEREDPETYDPQPRHRKVATRESEESAGPWQHVTSMLIWRIRVMGHRTLMYVAFLGFGLAPFAIGNSFSMRWELAFVQWMIVGSAAAALVGPWLSIGSCGNVEERLALG